MSGLMLALALCGQVADQPVAAVERIEATQSRLLAAIERLEQRIGDLERRGTVGISEVEPTAADPEKNATKGGRWVYHPQTGQAVFATSEFHRYRTPGGSLIIEPIRIDGKPVLGHAVTWGDNQPMTLPSQQAQEQAYSVERARAIRGAMER